ncbi:MAG: hypothetical protein RLZZ165_153 [Bacteroidota bacterium]|jgi:hypothetical protein
MNQRHLYHLGIFLVLVGLIVAGRYLPHFANFTPVAAAGFFAGYLFRNRLLAVAVPLVGMLLSDLLIQQYYPWATMATVYLCMVIPALMGGRLRTPATNFLERAGKIAMGAGTGSVLFYLGTNLAVWLFDGIYALNWDGLMACYTAAIPFLKFTLAGDLFFTAVLFGTHALVMRLVASRQTRMA